MCILLNVKKHEKTFALNVDIFNKAEDREKSACDMKICWGTLSFYRLTFNTLKWYDFDI